ncbi:MAG: tRNA (adenine-N1)-methyltransferase [Bacillota bacterium]
MPFKPGDLVFFLDHQGRFYPQRLEAGGRLYTHRGYANHDEILGREPGCAVKTSGGKELFAFYPTLLDYTMKMPRRSGIIYPKDTGIILLWADIFPGANVLCGGVGSGALLLALVRQVGAWGRVVAYDVRQDMLDHAARNLEAYFGLTPALTLKLGSIYDPVPETGFDRALLDVPEPWRAVETVYEALVPGGILGAYVPSIIQAEAFTTALRRSKAFTLIETLEVLIRDWHLEGRSVRPAQRMVGHTGFMTFARKLDRPLAVETPGGDTEPDSEAN